MRNIILLSDDYFSITTLILIVYIRISHLYLNYSRLNEFNYSQNNDNNIVGISAPSSV